MFTSVLLLCITSQVLAVNLPQYEFVEEWKMWKNRHGMSYESDLHDLDKHLVRLSNKKFIELHNANSHIFGYSLAMNHFGDLTDLEWNEKYGTYSSSSAGNYTKVFKADPYQSYPESVDWRTKGAVTSVKDQSQCGASYAFSAMAALEGANALATDTLVNLSEQNLIDCSVPYGNHGCKGGNMLYAFKYVIANEGVDTANSYPFYGKQSSCVYNEKYAAVKISGMVRISQGSESDLLGAVANVGPVAVAIDGSSNAFRFYSSGVYDSSRCSSSKLNHAIVVTGYGSYSGKKYWLVKNSWGKNWGNYGYIMMARGKYNQCGIASDASYPTL
uniref:Silicatein A1 n=1 Tax=Latrunculia oparinae TaxID=553186 RepID=B5B2Z1_LATOP|nr:silicatein A1 [Latrunculia oparinae]